MDKIEMLDKIVEHIESLRDRAETGRKEAQNDANQHIGAMASRYDTFKEEAQYMATAQEARTLQLNSELSVLLEVRATVARDDKPSRLSKLTSIVVLQDSNNEVTRYFLAPSGGGLVIDAPFGKCIVITPTSPLGRAIMNKAVGEEVEFQTGDVVKKMEIIDVF